MNDRKRIYLKVSIFCCLVTYFYLLCWLLFVNVGPVVRETHFKEPLVHFIPFQNTYSYIQAAMKYNFSRHYLNALLSNVFGNIVLLVPWGFLGPLTFRNLVDAWKIAMSGFLISLFAELLQYVFCLGVFDIDDIIFNTLGTILGYKLLQFSLHYFFENKA